MPGAPVYNQGPRFDEVLKQGGVVVATAGTPVPLSVISVPCIEILIQVKRGTTGRIYVGGPGVPNDDSAGIVLEPPAVGQTPPSIRISAQNLNQVYINSIVNSEGVNHLYW